MRIVESIISKDGNYLTNIYYFIPRNKMKYTIIRWRNPYSFEYQTQFTHQEFKDANISELALFEANRHEVKLTRENEEFYQDSIREKDYKYIIAELHSDFINNNDI